ncbi:transposase [Actinoplanes sp. NPDC023936]|uniref:transposase n=1 Tax=Actinoplanes sp. NPDC023936 TaxID=3154910 RepID=UPI003403A716
MALVRVYCGLASADDSVRTASAAPLTIAVVDDAGRLLGVHEISDDPAGYAQLGTLLVERTTGFSDAAVAADSDDHVVTSLLTAAGRPLVVVDDDDADDYAERFSDDDSPEEIAAPLAARRAVGLARALQAGAIAAINLPTPRELVSYKPVLAAHVAMLVGRNAAAVALREVLRELYPAALRAYPDPAHPLAMAVLEAVPEPGRITGRPGDTGHVTREIAGELARNGAGSDDQLIAAVTALQVAISESPRRGGVNKSLAPAAADAVRQAIGAIRSCDAACTALVGTLTARGAMPGAHPNVGRRAARRATTEPAPLQPVPTGENPRFGRRSRPEPATSGSGPAVPQPMTPPPVAPDPIAPPPIAPAAANGLPGLPSRGATPGNRPVSVPPPPPGMTPITPGTRPGVPASRPSATPTSAQPGGRATPAEAGEPFRPTLTNAELNRARAERQRTVIPSRPKTNPANGVPGGPTDFSLPLPAQPTSPAPSAPSAPSAPAQRPGQEISGPGSRANWPLLNPDKDDLAVPPPAAASVSPAAASVSPAPAGGRVKPPWQDMPKEPPPLRLVEGRAVGSPLDPAGSRSNASSLDPAGSRPGGSSLDPAGGRSSGSSLDPTGSRPGGSSLDPAGGRSSGSSLDPTGSRPGGSSLDPARSRSGGSSLDPAGSSPSLRASKSASRLTALDRSASPPVPADGNDGDLLIFAAARSAWFTGGTTETEKVDWSNPNDSGWRAAEKAATPAVAAETSAGLPKRVPQANLVPGSPLREERPLRIVRDAASIAAHTTGYFRGWRRGQEIGGFAMGGRPGREAAGGWDFTRDGQAADEYRDNNAGFGGR